MSPSLSPDAAIVARLRAAGCVFAEDEARLLAEAAGSAAELAAMVDRRVDGLPLEHLLGWAEFRGLRVAVAPGVFVPRTRTAFLVELALGHRPSVVLDLCCGSGALGMAVAAECGGVELYAADVSPAAVRCARVNLAPWGGRVFEGDLFDPLPASLRGRVDVLLANVPYVPTAAIATMPPEARDHEPTRALDGGPDGLAVLRRVAAGAGSWLADGGRLYVETSEAQAPAAAAAFEAAGLAAEVVSSAEWFATAVVGTRHAPSG